MPVRCASPMHGRGIVALARLSYYRFTATTLMEAIMSEGGHINIKRLYELAQIDRVVREPDWPHLKDCEACGIAFLQVVRELAESSDQLVTKGPS